MATESATLGGGGFWCLEAVYAELRGVTSVVSGYAGGDVVDPTYAQVCRGDTGHIEVVQITFDPTVVTYRDLLDVFFTIHDPTSRDRQGADAGVQYRSVVFYHSDEQRDIARATIADLEAPGIWDRPIVTEVRSLEVFYPGEAYHQGYFARHRGESYCALVIAPKVARFRKAHLERLKA